MAAGWLQVVLVVVMLMLPASTGVHPRVGHHGRDTLRRRLMEMLSVKKNKTVKMVVHKSVVQCNFDLARNLV